MEKPEVNRIYQGDCLEVMRSWPTGLVQMCVTSPPYYGLRNYDLPSSIWGGDPSCAHIFNELVTPAANGCVKDNVIEGKNIHSATKRPRTSHLCAKCGAWKGCLGLEPTPDMYVRHMVDVFREVKRVLRDDGTLWLNLGDTYAANPSGNKGNYSSSGLHGGKISEKYRQTLENSVAQKSTGVPNGYKRKDMLGIPFLVAFALQKPWRVCMKCGLDTHESDWGIVRDMRGVRRFICPNCMVERDNRISEFGWYFRMDNVWHKPNPMPSSAEDRPTKSHEFVFLMSKSVDYFYDNEAVKELTTHGHEAEWDNGRSGHGGGESHAGQGSSTRKFGSDPSLRNRRSVWTITTVGFPDAHFATFPEKLVEPCIMAGSSEKGACGECGAPLMRIVKKPDMADRPLRKTAKQEGERIGTNFDGYPQSAGQKWQAWRDANPNETTGWWPTCGCAGDLRSDDLEVIGSPTGDARPEDLSLFVGRAGMSRPRGENEGRRLMTRWEQRDIADQIKASEHRTAMEKECGSAFSHYIRKDRTGARPVPEKILDGWYTKGWIKRRTPPIPSDIPTVPCIVLEPFAGSGTGPKVAARLGRSFLGVELGEEYVVMGMGRVKAEVDQGKLL